MCSHILSHTCIHNIQLFKYLTCRGTHNIHVHTCTCTHITHLQIHPHPLILPSSPDSLASLATLCSAVTMAAKGLPAASFYSQLWLPSKICLYCLSRALGSLSLHFVWVCICYLVGSSMREAQTHEFFGVCLFVCFAWQSSTGCVYLLILLTFFPGTLIVEHCQSWESAASSKFGLKCLL